MKLRIEKHKNKSQQKHGSATCPARLTISKYLKTIYILAIIFFSTSFTSASKVTDAISKGNQLYNEGNYTAAADEYTRAIELDPSHLAAKFNKGNSEYRLSEIDSAMDAYKEVAARSKDPELVAKAKYNLGRSYFKKAEQAEQATQTAQNAGGLPPLTLAEQIENYRAAVKSLRQVLSINPDNQKAIRNIEIAKSKLKKLKDQQKQQQKQQDQQQDEQQDENNDQNQDQQNSDQQKNDNQNDDKKEDQQNKDDQQNEDSNQHDQQQQNDQEQQQSGKEDEKQDPLDRLADEILKKEKQDKEARRILMLRQIPVKKDW